MRPLIRDATPGLLRACLGTCVLAALLGGELPSLSRSAQAQAAAPARGAHDLQALLAAAEGDHPGLEAREHAILAARARLDEARISPFFQWTATAALSLAPEASGTPIFSPDDQLPLSNAWRPLAQVGIEGVVPLSITKLRDLRRAARANLDASRGALESARARVRFDVRRAYFMLQMSLDIAQMISEVRGRLASAVERLEAALERGDPEADELDLFKLRRALSDIDSHRSDARQLEQSMRGALRALTGLEAIRVPECPLEPLRGELPGLGALLERSTEARPERQMLEAALRARRANVSLNVAAFFPDLGLAFWANHSVAPGITDQTNPFVIDRANYTSIGAALVARWSLDLWGNAYRTDRARAELAQTEADAAMADRGMRLEVETTFTRFEAASERLETWERGHREGRRWFITAAQGYQVGTVDADQLVDGVRGYMTARYAHLQAIVELDTSAAELERVVGEAVFPAEAWPRCEE
ncbi:MAG: TolC family protein [Myxococcales bacterium]|nr:TolC family protein [Myxococcales bacterium]